MWDMIRQYPYPRERRQIGSMWLLLIHGARIHMRNPIKQDLSSVENPACEPRMQGCFIRHCRWLHLHSLRFIISVRMTLIDQNWRNRSLKTLLGIWVLFSSTKNPTWASWTNRGATILIFVPNYRIRYGQYRREDTYIRSTYTSTSKWWKPNTTLCISKKPTLCLWLRIHYGQEVEPLCWWSSKGVDPKWPSICCK